MKKIPFTILLSALCVAPVAVLGASDADVSGSATVGVMGVDQDGDSAKFDEYRDMDDGTYGDVEIRAFFPRYYLELDAASIGRADESYRLKGGRFGQFKYSLFYDELPHHLSAGATTFYAGAGTDYLANTGESSDPSRWAGVDYRKDLRKYGFDGEFSFGTPFYLKFGAAEKNTNGVSPLGGNSTIAAFGSTTELPAPVSWDEALGFVEGGYRTSALVATVKAEFSSFDNDDDEFLWEDDFALSPAIRPDATTGAPDNDFWKLSGQLVWKTPALSSSLALRATYSQLESSTAIRSTVASDTPAGASSIAVEPATFDGDISYTSFDAGWSLVPLPKLSLEIFLKHLDKNNDSTVVHFAAGGNSEESEVFDYRKSSAGLDASYVLPAEMTLDAGYAFTTVDRDGRLDSEGSDDNLLYLQLRNISLAQLELRARYEYLDRKGDFAPKEAGSSPADSEYIRNFMQRFDVADQTRQAVELEAATSLADVGLAVEFDWNDSDYSETEIGLTGATHYGVYLTADYTSARRLSAGLYVGYENDKTDMDSRNYAPGQPADPGAGTVGSAYNWSERKEFDTYAYGLHLEAPLGQRMVLSAKWDHSKVDGKADFASGGATKLRGLDSVEDYTQQELTIGLTYRLTSRFSLRAGYTYENYDFADDQWDGYTLRPNAATLLSGAYADSDYTANIAFIETTYQF
jgi:MtrB/PioB family decaheme-associated outer membrane protein